MNVTLVAATGGVGRQLVAQARAAGHAVTAVARRPVAADGVRAVQVDLAAPGTRARDELVLALRGADAVLSALGRRTGADQGIAARGTRAVIEAMEDLAAMEDALRASPLEWTIVRPPRLTDGPLTGRYRTAVDRNVRGGLTVSRADLAHLMLRAAGDPATVGRALGVGD